MSLWQIAQAVVLIITSPGPGAASSIVSIVSGAPNARQTAALVFMEMVPDGIAFSPASLWGRERQEFKKRLAAGVIDF
jgi:hypothetical protein